jgi:hypothetical protein
MRDRDVRSGLREMLTRHWFSFHGKRTAR